MRIRTIKPEFWIDEDLASVSPMARLMAIALLNYADDEGYFNANPVLIKSQLFPFEEDSMSVHGVLNELSGVGYIQLSIPEKCGKQYGRITNFKSHQVISRPTVSKIKSCATFTEGSMRTHGVLNEDSIGKGKERKGKELPPGSPPAGGPAAEEPPKVESEIKTKSNQAQKKEAWTARMEKFIAAIEPTDESALMKVFIEWVRLRWQMPVRKLQDPEDHFKRQLAEMRELGEEAGIACLKYSIINAYQGLFTERYRGHAGPRPQPPTPSEKRNAFIAGDHKQWTQDALAALKRQGVEF